MKKSRTLLTTTSMMLILVLLLTGCAQQVESPLSSTPTPTETGLPPSPTGASSTLAPVPGSYRLDVPRVYAGLKDINEGNQ